MYIKVYDISNTILLVQTAQFPEQSQSGSKYIMVMVEIDSNTISVEPLKSHKDAELTGAY